MARPNVEIDVATLREIDEWAQVNDRSRAAEIRVLLGEALASRVGVRGAEGLGKAGVSRKVKGSKK